MLTQAAIFTEFGYEAGDAVTLTDVNQVTAWFNQGQSRLDRKKLKRASVSWVGGDDELSPTLLDVYQLEHFVYTFSSRYQEWQQVGSELRVISAEGTTQSGTAILYYRGDWPDVDNDSASELPRVGDTACIYYALSRFFRRLASNRAQYKRYATLLGANAVSENDLLNLADAYFNDFLTTQADFPNEPTAYFHPV